VTFAGADRRPLLPGMANRVRVARGNHIVSNELHYWLKTCGLRMAAGVTAALDRPMAMLRAASKGDAFKRSFALATPSSSDKAFEAELVALIPQLRAFGRTLSGSSAQGDDLAQDALARALSHRASFQMGTNMKAWTFMILRHLFYSERRRSWRSTALDPEVAERTLVSAETASGALELDEVRRALAQLPLEQREAIVLVGAAGCSYEEVSDITGIAIGTVKSRVSRGRDRLALIYAEGFIPIDATPAHGAVDAIFAQVENLKRSRNAPQSARPPGQIDPE